MKSKIKIKWIECLNKISKIRVLSSVHMTATSTTRIITITIALTEHI